MGIIDAAMISIASEPPELSRRKASKTTLLWSTRAAQTLVPCVDGRSFHINHQLSTGLFRLPVNVVGNWGGVKVGGVLFSKTPEMHRHDLENRSSGQVTARQSLRNDFHFSCLNYGDYCLFI